MSAATWPTCALSAPVTTMCVCFSMAIWMPSGIAKLDGVGFAEREGHDLALQFGTVADAHDIEILLETRVTP